MRSKRKLLLRKSFAVCLMGICLLMNSKIAVYAAELPNESMQEEVQKENDIQEESGEAAKTQEESIQEESGEETEAQEESMQEESGEETEAQEEGIQEESGEEADIQEEEVQEEYQEDNLPDEDLKEEDFENESLEGQVLQEITQSEGQEITEEGRQEFNKMVADKAILALVYLTDSYTVKCEADDSSDEVTVVQSGQTVQILDVEIAEDAIWYKTGFFQNDNYYEGYIERSYLVSSDEELLTWEKNYLPESEDELVRAGNNRDIENFPGSYQAALSALKSRHPNWTFVKMNTNLDWNTVIANELGERSLVHSSVDDLWKNGKYSNGWYYATEDILKYFMDPRNFLTEDYIFQFEQLTYNATYHTRDAVQNILNTTFMSGSIPDSNKTYAQAFWEIGNSLKVSPFHLACRVYQEQGNGTSALISGTFSGYEGLYNYFNIGASGNTDYKVITSGLERARKEGWTSRYLSLSGGAKIISQNYILKGQDTLYLQKFDVDASYNGLYWHQYMQNIQAPSTEGQGIRRAYISTDSLDSPFVFKIPVYNNMPASACDKPTEGDDIVSDIPFTDVEYNPGNWRYDSVKYVYENGIMNGINGTTRFDPDEPLSRGMFATVLYRMAGQPSVTFESRFTDVELGRYYSDAVIWAYRNGIVKGYDDGSFGVNDDITREQMAKMLNEYANVMKYDTGARTNINTFPDAAEVSGWARDYMSWAVGVGMINGKNQNGVYYLDPKGNATRVECAAMLTRFMEKYK